MDHHADKSACDDRDVAYLLAMIVGRCSTKLVMRKSELRARVD